jgi:hypothetical protein
LFGEGEKKEEGLAPLLNAPEWIEKKKEGAFRPPLL